MLTPRCRRPSARRCPQTWTQPCASWRAWTPCASTNSPTKSRGGSRRWCSSRSSCASPAARKSPSSSAEPAALVGADVGFLHDLAPLQVVVLHALDGRGGRLNCRVAAGGADLVHHHLVGAGLRQHLGPVSYTHL